MVSKIQAQVYGVDSVKIYYLKKKFRPKLDYDEYGLRNRIALGVNYLLLNDSVINKKFESFGVGLDSVRNLTNNFIPRMIIDIYYNNSIVSLSLNSYYMYHFKGVYYHRNEYLTKWIAENIHDYSGLKKR